MSANSINMADLKSAIAKNDAFKKIASDFATAPTTDHIALISTVTNAVKIYQKTVVIPSMKREEVESSPYFKSVDETSMSRCIVAAIPAVGNTITMGADFLRVFDSLKDLFPKHKQLETFLKLCSFATTYFFHPNLPWIKEDTVSNLIAHKKSMAEIKITIQEGLIK